MCTPSKKEIREKDEENEGKLEEYWNYLKQANIFKQIINYQQLNHSK